MLILGPSGSGKSSLALDLIGLGARLVSDDRTRIHLDGGRPIASCPSSIAGLIEARFIGVLKLPSVAQAPIELAIDLGNEESDRLPPRRNIDILGQRVTLLYRPPGVFPPSAILHCLAHSRMEP